MENQERKEQKNLEKKRMFEGKEQQEDELIESEEREDRVYSHARSILMAMDGFIKGYPDQAVLEALRRVGVAGEEGTFEQEIGEIESYVRASKSNVDDFEWSYISRKLKNKYPKLEEDFPSQLVHRSSGIVTLNMLEVVWFQINAENTFRIREEETVYTINRKGTVEVLTKTSTNTMSAMNNLSVKGQSLIVQVNPGDQILQTEEALMILVQLPSMRQMSVQPSVQPSKIS